MLTAVLHPLLRPLVLFQDGAVTGVKNQRGVIQSRAKSSATIVRNPTVALEIRSFSAIGVKRHGIRHVINLPFQSTSSRSRQPNGFAEKCSGQKQNPADGSNDPLEFGGTLGVCAIMTIFPILMYYLWIGASFYDGHLPWPAKDQSLRDFAGQLGSFVYERAFPNLKAWVIYWGFMGFEVICYLYLPGITVHGKPLPHEKGRRLEYYCSGLWSFYTNIVVAAALHFSGVFKLYTLLDEFGPIMSVAIISAIGISLVAYFSALYRGATIRMTGRPIYDFFMGAELNPRMFGLLDLKMFSEVRIPWYMLFFISSAAAARQYEQFGYVTGEIMFLVMAHFLYANACAKGEECITTTW